MLAAVRPLTLDEANIALTLAIQEQQPDSYADVKADLWPRDKFRSIVTNLCGLFISVYDSKLSFIHQTAREFLLDSKQEGNWKGRFNMPQSHSAISRTCLFQLLSPDINRPPNDDPAQDEQHPYFAYAASYWPLHFVSQEVTNTDSFRRHTRTLYNTAGHQASIWAPSYLKQQDLRWTGCSDLILASYLDLSEVVYDILFKEKSNVNIEAKDGYYSRTALSWAAENGHKAVVELLLEKGAEIEAKDSYHSQTALLWAARNGYEAVVELLLKKGAEIEVKDHIGQTALLLAARNGYEAVVELLLEKGAEIEAKDKYSQTALLLAARNGYEAVVELLLKKGAEIEVKDHIGPTALLRATQRGHVAVVKLLSSSSYAS
jgi:ankyrin repeat protein